MTSASLELGRPHERGRPWLRLATPADLEVLRNWRNANAIRFYHQEPVSPEGQRRWFESYVTRPDDYLFMVMEGDHPVGCVGLRLLHEAWDVYNVIRGDHSPGSKGFMSLALEAILEFARRTCAVPVGVEVLPDNPALRWYLANGFVVIDRDAVCVRMVHARSMGPVGEEAS